MRKCLIAFLCGLLVSFQVSAQNKVIKGRVTDETSNPVPNASVEEAIVTAVNEGYEVVQVEQPSALEANGAAYMSATIQIQTQVSL